MRFLHLFLVTVLLTVLIFIGVQLYTDYEFKKYPNPLFVWGYVLAISGMVVFLLRRDTTKDIKT